VGTIPIPKSIGGEIDNAIPKGYGHEEEDDVDEGDEKFVAAHFFLQKDTLTKVSSW
jgi:hypothetical protein